MRLDQPTMEILSQLAIDGNTVRISIQLDRKDYLKINDVLTACGGTWNRKRKAHVFEGVDEAGVRERLDAAMVTGQVVTIRELRAELGLFLTPPPLARHLVEMADVRKGSFVLEPSAGTGRIVEAALAVGANVTAVERDPTMRRALAARNLPWLAISAEDDFMNVGPSTFGSIRFERVVMNPPFCKSGKGDHLDHVRHAFDFLGRGGVLVAVLPASVNFRQDKRHREFRAWAEPIGTFRDLPDGSFKESGTLVRTCTLRAVKL